jgi:hypothetical protein
LRCASGAAVARIKLEMEKWRKVVRDVCDATAAIRPGRTKSERFV